MNLEEFLKGEKVPARKCGFEFNNCNKTVILRTCIHVKTQSNQKNAGYLQEV